MNILELNKEIARCDPYTEKSKRRYLVGIRRNMENHINKSIEDIKNNVNIPAMLLRQSR